MTIAQMRAWLKGYYNNAKMWSAKVDRMSDRQVYAIYMRKLNGKAP